jgi:cell division inhibitor SulA
MAPEKLTDERLCWLAVREDLARKANNGPGITLIKILTARSRGRGRAGRSTASELVSDRMTRYAVAVDELAGKLSREERATLRTAGTVPAWFLGEVERRSAELKKTGF